MEALGKTFCVAAKNELNVRETKNFLENVKNICLALVSLSWGNYSFFLKNGPGSCCRFASGFLTVAKTTPPPFWLPFFAPL